jgi:hypothetical protein
MSGWTEQMIRSAASWQAFKEGKALLESGLVSYVKTGHAGWQGAVRVGKRMLKVTVLVKSPTHLDTRCPCADNQRSGSVCCHAVATGLATLKKPVAPPEPKIAAVSKPTPAPAAPAAWQILLPLNWREALKNGRFAATLAISNAEISAADERLSAWLSHQGVVRKEILSISLNGPQISSFLETLAEHPRLAAGKDRLSIEIRSGQRLPLRLYWCQMESRDPGLTSPVLFGRLERTQ